MLWEVIVKGVLWMDIKINGDMESQEHTDESIDTEVCAVVLFIRFKSYYPL